MSKYTAPFTQFFSRIQSVVCLPKRNLKKLSSVSVSYSNGLHRQAVVLPEACRNLTRWNGDHPGGWATASAGYGWLWLVGVGHSSFFESICEMMNLAFFKITPGFMFLKPPQGGVPAHGAGLDYAIHKLMVRIF